MKDEKSKEAESDFMIDLLRQMGLGEEEIGATLNLAQSIEKKIELKSKTEAEITTSKFENLSKDELIKLSENQKIQLNHFQNAVALQLILLIKKYKDRIIVLENRIQQKNAQIKELSQQLEFLHK